MCHQDCVFFVNLGIKEVYNLVTNGESDFNAWNDGI